jgi:NAD(P)H-hydrate epimerase
MGEFAAYCGLQKDEILKSPIQALRGFCAKAKAVIRLKSHVIYVASPDGRLGIIDGMNPVLATGGTGDVLAGFCSSIAARWRACVLRTSGKKSSAFDAFACACAAGALLMQAAESKGIAGKFADPAEIARAASSVAGSAWMEA